MRAAEVKPPAGRAPVPVLLVTSLLGLSPWLAAAQHRPPAVLFVGTHWGSCCHEVARVLVEDGLALQAHGGLMRSGLNWERARQFNVIVALGLGQSNADGSLPPEVEQTLATLNRFLEAGGGVLILPFFGQMATEAEPLKAFLGPLGATPLFGEMVVDPGAITATAWRVHFAETTDIAATALTQGVSRLWVPVPPGRIGAQNHTTTAVFGPEWEVIVRGAESTLTRPRRRLMDNSADESATGTYASSPPLVAVRNVGAGRLAYLGVTPEYVFGAHALTTLEAVFLSSGLEGRPSNGLTLVRQALAWLAEPSRERMDLGGAAMDPALLEDPYKTRFGEPFQWSDELEFPAARPAFVGAIGARTDRTTGVGSVADWVTAAKAEGLSFLVFLEDFSELSSEELDSLKAECAEASADGFWALPGFTIDDEVGNHYFYFGPNIAYPKADYLTDDGRRLCSYDTEISPDSPRIPGQLAMTTLNYAYADSAFKLTAGNYLFGQDEAPFVDFFSNWNATAVVTAREGDVIEDATEGYLSLVDSGQGPLPLAIHLMREPSQLAAAPWRTVLRLPREGGGLIAGELRGDTLIRDYFNMWHFYPDNPSTAYVTSGPDIEYWGYVGPRDYEGHTRGDFVWQNYRWKLRGRVTSGVGLEEVLVRDGPSLFRRFLPGGAREFEFTLDLTHDQQHNLVILATDLAGGRAVSGEQWDRNHRAEEFMCSDRNNQLSYGYLTNSDGLGMMIGGNQSLGTYLKRVDGGEISPPGTFRNDALLGAPAFDGAAGGDPALWLNPTPAGAAEPVRPPDVCEAFRRMHSADFHIGEGLREHRFSDGVGVYNVWHTLWRTEPAPDYRRRDRRTFIQVDPDSPIAVFVLESELELLRDLSNGGLEIGSMHPRDSRSWAIREANGALVTGAWGSPGESRTIALAPGGYAAALDSPLGSAAVWPLTGGVSVHVPGGGLGPLVFTLARDRSPQLAGERARVSFVVAGFPRAGARTSGAAGRGLEAVERLHRDLGLDGGGGTYVLSAETGEVLDRRHMLRVDGSEASCFAGRIEGDLISTLPIVVSGLNDKWSSYLVDRAPGLARPIAMFEGAAWATVPMHGAADLFIGHPVVADSADLFIQVTQSGEAAWTVEVHNPTDAAIRTTVRTNPWFPLLSGHEELVEIPAGSSVHRTWEG